MVESFLCVLLAFGFFICTIIRLCCVFFCSLNCFFCIFSSFFCVFSGFLCGFSGSLCRFCSFLRGFNSLLSLACISTIGNNRYERYVTRLFCFKCRSYFLCYCGLCLVGRLGCKKCRSKSGIIRLCLISLFFSAGDNSSSIGILVNVRNGWVKLSFLFFIHFNPYPSAGLLILGLACDSLTGRLNYMAFAFSTHVFSICTFNICTFSICTFCICAFNCIASSNRLRNYAASRLFSALNGLASSLRNATCSLRAVFIGFICRYILRSCGIFYNLTGLGSISSIASLFSLVCICISLGGFGSGVCRFVIFSIFCSKCIIIILGNAISCFGSIGYSFLGIDYTSCICILKDVRSKRTKVRVITRSVRIINVRNGGCAAIVNGSVCGACRLSRIVCGACGSSYICAGLSCIFGCCGFGCIIYRFCRFCSFSLFLNLGCLSCFFDFRNSFVSLNASFLNDTLGNSIISFFNGFVVFLTENYDSGIRVFNYILRNLACFAFCGACVCFICRVTCRSALSGGLVSGLVYFVSRFACGCALAGRLISGFAYFISRFACRSALSRGLISRLACFVRGNGSLFCYAA